MGVLTEFFVTIFLVLLKYRSAKGFLPRNIPKKMGEILNKITVNFLLMICHVFYL